MIYHPFDRAAPQVLPEGMKARSLLSAIEVIEYANLLTSESWASKWAWTFRNQVQWHAMAYVLADLCRRPNRNDLVDRAWRTLDDAFRGLDGPLEKCTKGALWHSMKKLRARAETLRGISPPFPTPAAVDDKPCGIFNSSNDVWGQTVLGPNFYHPPSSSSAATVSAAAAAAATPGFSLSGSTTPELIELDAFTDVVGPWTMVDDTGALSSHYCASAGFDGLGVVGGAFDGLAADSSWAGMMCAY